MKWMIIIWGLLSLVGCQSKPEGFVIKGEFQGAPENEWVYLMNTGQTMYYDSVQLKKGRFEFKGKVDYPELRCITYFNDPSQRFMGGIRSWSYRICGKFYYSGFFTFCRVTLKIREKSTGKFACRRFLCS